jgi:hypothetical protein
MKTTATNRKIRELLTQLREGKLQPRPEFQRRLVWSNKDKSAFLETVLRDLPFPEIYVAAGAVDVDTGIGSEMLVDGQQRITTLYQYFTGLPDLKLSKGLKPYAELHKEEKERFLQYDVVVRDMGKVEVENIKEVFQRINATRYSLNAMEIHNARYEGEYKNFADQIAQHKFFDSHRIFSATETKRMQDTRFVLSVVTTVLSTYFNRDDEIEDYLKQYNDEFPMAAQVREQLERVFDFVETMALPSESRAWQKADLFTLLVELCWALVRDSVRLRPNRVAQHLISFYENVDAHLSRAPVSTKQAWEPKMVASYYNAALQATNDRGSRIARGEVIRRVIRDRDGIV